MIKNVIVVNDYDYVQGGATLVAIEQANLLYESGFNVVFFCGVSNKDKSTLNPNIRIIVVDEYDSLNNPNKIKGMLSGANNKKAYKKMFNLLSEFDAHETIVSIHGYTKCLSTSFIKACNESGVKTILTAHDYFSICPNGGLFNYKKNRICNKQGKISCQICNCDSRNYLFKIYRNYRFWAQNRKFKFRDSIDYLITISETNEKLLRPFFKSSEIVRIYNPTSIGVKEERTKCENNDYYIYVGRVDKEKGIDLMCQSIKQAHEKIIIVGSGASLDELKSNYESENIRFVGWQSHNEVIKFMREAKALIFPSLLYEGAPLTIFEAQSQGLPCIVSNYSNGKDFVNEENGFIYNPYDNSLNNLLKSITKEILYNKSISSYETYWNEPFTKGEYIKKTMDLINRISMRLEN